MAAVRGFWRAFTKQQHFSPSGRCRKATVGGLRPNSHFLALEALGTRIEVGADVYIFETDGLVGKDLGDGGRLDE